MPSVTMLSRRELLLLAGTTAGASLLPGCASSPLLHDDQFNAFGDGERPYLGLAITLREEPDYRAEVEGVLPRELVGGTLYRNGPGLFDRTGRRKRNLLDGDGLVQAFRFDGQGVQYRARFVRTEKFVDEQAAGRFICLPRCTKVINGAAPWQSCGPSGLRMDPLAVVRLRHHVPFSYHGWWLLPGQER